MEKRTVIINPARVGEEMRKKEQEEKEKREKEEREKREQEDRNRMRNTYRGPRTANLGEFIVEDRRRGRQRYEDRNRTEDKGQDLTPEEVKRRKKEREERFEENKRKRAEQEKERIEKAEREKEKYKGNLVEQYKKAKRAGNRDVANRLFTMMAKFGVDLGQID